MNKERSMTAFYLETLLMVLIFVVVIVIISQVLGLAKEKSREADQLNSAVCLALNAAEAVEAADSPKALGKLLDETGSASVTRQDGTPTLAIWYDGSMQPLTEEEANAAEDALRMEVTWEPEEQRTGTFVRSQIRVYAKAGQAEPVYTLEAGAYRREVAK